MDIFPIQLTLKLTIHLKSVFVKNNGFAYFCKISWEKCLVNVEIVLNKNGEVNGKYRSHLFLSLEHKKASENHLFRKPSPFDHL